MIEVRNISKYFGERLVLDDVSFTIKKGEIVGLLGLNGAGKSTTMNIIVGILSASSGEVIIDDLTFNEHAQAIKKKIGYLPEIPPLYVDMTVAEYLSFVFDLKQVSDYKQAHIDEVSKKAGVQEVSGRLIKNLSKGYKQRVGIAASLLGNPEILIFDEPTVGLDPNQIIEIRNLIAEMGKEHTIILSSHILSEVQSVCERIIILKEGQIVGDDTPERLKANYLQRMHLNLQIKGNQTEIEALLESMDGVYEVHLRDEIKPSLFVYELVYDGHDKSKERIFYECAKAKLPILSMSDSASLEDVFLDLVNVEASIKEDV